MHITVYTCLPVHWLCFFKFTTNCNEKLRIVAPDGISRCGLRPMKALASDAVSKSLMVMSGPRVACQRKLLQSEKNVRLENRL